MATLVPGDGEVVLLALSGGPDSCALLLALKALSASGRFALQACHINHGLRGQESDEDEQFCARLCSHVQIPLHARRMVCHTADEAALRQGRYAALISVAQYAGSKYVATGHTQDDQVETVLFRLFRGSAPGGLTAMAQARALSEQITLIRPLLAVPRCDVEAYLARLKLTARQDSSNQSLEYGRNYIRRVVIPAIAERFPSYRLSVERMRNVFKEDNELIDHVCKIAWQNVAVSESVFSLAQFAVQPVSIQRRLLVEALRCRNVEVTFERVEAMLQLALRRSGALALDRSWLARADAESLSFEFSGDADPEAAGGWIDRETLLKVPGLTLAKELSLSVQIDELTEGAASAGRLEFPLEGACEAVVDLSAAAFPLVVRTRRPGDVIQPFGMNTKVKLKKYLHTHKSTGSINPLRAVVVADAEEVLWVPGVGISEKLRVNASATHRLRLLDLETDNI